MQKIINFFLMFLLGMLIGYIMIHSFKSQVKLIHENEKWRIENFEKDHDYFRAIAQK